MGSAQGLRWEVVSDTQMEEKGTCKGDMRTEVEGMPWFAGKKSYGLQFFKFYSRDARTYTRL